MNQLHEHLTRDQTWSRQHRIRGALSVLLLLHAILLATNGWLQSPTLNEPGHLVAGLHHLSTGGFALYRVNPPLVRLVAALPSIFTGYTEDWSSYNERIGARPVFEMGEDFVAANNRRSMLNFRLARWACIPFSLLGAGICFAWARDLFGEAAGLLACALWCFSPMVLGHASMIAPDAHATAFGLTACYTFWRWLRYPTWYQAIVTGIVLGLAELSKMTMILFYPLWPLLWLLYRWRDRNLMHVRRWQNESGMLVLRMAVGIYVLNLGYLGEGSFSQLKDFQFVSQMFAGNNELPFNGGNRFRESCLGEIPVPLPTNYVIGIDVQQRDFEDFSRPSYLRGRYEPKGWWYYYAYAILVKAPLGTLGLILLTTGITIFRIDPRLCMQDAMVLLAPAIVIFFVVSSKTGFSHHSRYILPCVPFVFIWVSQLAPSIVMTLTAITNWFGNTAVSPSCESTVQVEGPTTLPADSQTRKLAVSDRKDRRMCYFYGAFASLLLAWSITSSLSIYPHSLSYFNELAGGPKNGPEHLLNSNIDWGQDLLFLERWIVEQADDPTPVFLAFDNFYSPFDLAIPRIQPWPFKRKRTGDADVSTASDVQPGFYALSVNQLYEFPWPLRGHEKRLYYIDTRPLAYLRSIEPIGWAGYSIRIYSAEQLRAAYAAPASAPLWAGFDKSG